MTHHPDRSWRRRLSSEAAALGPDLVSAYIALCGGPAATSRELLLHGYSYSPNVLCRVRRGAMACPEPLREVAMVAVLAELVGDAAPDVARVLSPPERG